MKRLCASSVLAAVDSFVKTVGAGHGPWAGKGEALAKAIGVPFATLQGQEITETAKWVHQIMDRDVTHPQCSDQHTADSDATGYLHKLVTCSHNSPQEALKRTADGTLEPRVLCEDMPEKSVADGGTPVNFTAIAERRSHRLWADMSRDALKFQV
ncbi:hypothetical protein FOL47_004434 [Perkinsus chesapeaki]|uniref:Uncharacterized protein n=1 Tax=Perkinsus chesapeaki TaxID=330153 RepID=A0A7J6KJU5_PERCH|nr:hypothetical protein FOL47_004434 [Perkinsus chesapeaki]